MLPTRRHVTIELGAILACVLWLGWKFRRLLSGETIMIHDNLYGELPLFHFFAESVLNVGHLPLWDPYSFGGTPLYPLLGHARLLDPLTLLIIRIGGTFTSDVILLAQWNRCLQSLMMAAGVYLIYRPWANGIKARLALIPVVFLSYFILASFRQPGLFYLFAWIPYIAYFLLRIVYHRDYRISHWLLLGACVGMNWQSYYFSATWTFLLLFFLGFALFRRDCLRDLVRHPAFLRNTLLTAVISVAMLTPSLVILFEQDRLAFPLRMTRAETTGGGGPVVTEGGTGELASPVFLSYETLWREGVHGGFWLPLQSLLPDGAFFQGPAYSSGWRALGDGHVYLGVIVFVLAVYGLFFGRHPLKYPWMVISGGLLWMLLGPVGGLHRILFEIFPHVRVLRHTAFLALPALFAFLFFFVIGMNAWLEAGREKRILVLAFLVVTFGSIALGAPHVPNRIYFLIHLFLSIGTVFLARYRFGAWALAMALAIDFGLAVSWVNPLYELAPHPSKVIAVEREPAGPRFPGARVTHATPIPPAEYRGVHHLAMLYRQPATLALPLVGNPRNFAEALASPRIAEFLVGKEHLRLLNSQRPPEEIEKVLFIGEPPIQLKPGGAFSYAVDTYFHGNLELSTRSTADGELIWTDAHDRWWYAAIDGKDVPIVPTPGNSKSIVLPAGEHVVTFRYRPLPFLASLFCFYGAFFFAVGWAIVSRVSEYAQNFGSRRCQGADRPSVATYARSITES